MTRLLILALLLGIPPLAYASEPEEEPVLLRYKEESEKETVLMERDEILIEGHYTDEEKRMNKLHQLDRIYRNSNPETDSGGAGNMGNMSADEQLLIQNLNKMFEGYQKQLENIKQFQRGHSEALLNRQGSSSQDNRSSRRKRGKYSFR